jgi:hypothetical protein
MFYLLNALYVGLRWMYVVSLDCGLPFLQHAVLRLYTNVSDNMSPYSRLNSEDGGSMCVRTVGVKVEDCTARQPISPSKLPEP